MSGIQRLAEAMRRYLKVPDALEGAPAGPGSLVDQGRVVNVLESGLVAMVEYQGEVVAAILANDEPLFAGNLVYIARAKNGNPVVLGIVK